MYFLVFIFTFFWMLIVICYIIISFIPNDINQLISRDLYLLLYLLTILLFF